MELDLVEVGAERSVVAVVELRLLVEDVGQVLVPVGLQRLLGERAGQPGGLPEDGGPVLQLARQVRQRVENGGGVLRRHQLLLLGTAGKARLINARRRRRRGVFPSIRPTAEVGQEHLSEKKTAARLPIARLLAVKATLADCALYTASDYLQSESSAI